MKTTYTGQLVKEKNKRAEKFIKDALRKNGMTDDDITPIMEGILIPYNEYLEKVNRLVDQSGLIH